MYYGTWMSIKVTKNKQSFTVEDSTGKIKCPKNHSKKKCYCQSKKVAEKKDSDTKYKQLKVPLSMTMIIVILSVIVAFFICIICAILRQPTIVKKAPNQPLSPNPPTDWVKRQDSEKYDSYLSKTRAESTNNIMNDSINHVPSDIILAQHE